MNLWLMAGVVYLVLLCWGTYKIKVYIPTIAMILLVAGIITCLLGVFGTTPNLRIVGCMLAWVVLMTIMLSWVSCQQSVSNHPR